MISLIFPEILPAVLSNGRFTLTAKMLNFTGGIFFLAGVAYCLIRFDCRQDTISALFAIYCLLFGVVGLTFMFTKLWSPGWWLLHLARLGAYVVAFKYVSTNSSAEYMFLVRSKETLGRAKVRAEESKRELERVNKQLEKSVQKANLLAQRSEASNRATSEFLANMSHELRTPLHSILSFASFGTKKYANAEPEKLLDYFNRIKKSGQTLLELLNDLLDLAKLESKKVMFTFEPSDLGVLVRSVTNELDTLLSERNLSVRHEVSKFDGEVTLDIDKIKRVLRNLLDNAIKFSPEGGIIDVAVCRVASSVRVSVRDQGPGIPEDELEVVFDKFIQSSKTKTGAGGTGLGLAICLEIVTAHKGRIWAENRPEGGAVFSFEIPLSMDTHTEDQLVLAGAENSFVVEK
jgi:signal transduction histidine kinase